MSELMRWVWLLVAGCVMWWGLSVVSDTWHPAARSSFERVSYERTLAAAIAEVEDASNRLDARVRSAGVGEDLSNGWEDLRQDTLSILREMARRPDVDDVHDFAVRVDTFWNTYAPSAGIGPDTGEWRRFEEAFRAAIGARRVAISDVSALNES